MVREELKSQRSGHSSRSQRREGHSPGSFSHPSRHSSRGSSYSHHYGTSDSDSSVEEDVGRKILFPAEDAQLLVKTVRTTMGCKDETDSEDPAEEMFSDVGERKRKSFPIPKNVWSVVHSQWKKPDKRPYISSASKRKYPFSDEIAGSLNKTPKVDAPLSSLARKTALPFEDGASLKDAMDRKVEGSLKHAWEASMGSIRTNIATSCTTRSALKWMDTLKANIVGGAPRKELLDALETIQKATEYVADGLIDSLRLTANSSAAVNTARRAVWLRTWDGDLASKQRLCALPCNGERLFGEALDEALDRAGDKKKKLLSGAQPPSGRFSRQPNRNRDPRPRSRRPWKNFSKGFLSQTQKTFNPQRRP